MADRYQKRPFPADHGQDRGDQPASAKGESDPLAELARLIGQTDPFGAMGRANQQVQPRANARDQYQQPQYQPPQYQEPQYQEPQYQEPEYQEPQYQEPEAYDEDPPAAPPPWIRRAVRHDVAPQDYARPEQDYPSAVHPLKGYATPLAAPEPDYHQPQTYHDAGREPDPSRYDDALYGQLDAGQDSQHDQAYADDPYAYQDDYDDGPEEQVPKRRAGMSTGTAS